MIWVVSEIRETSPAPSTYEALGAGRLLSDSFNTGLNLVAIGSGLEGFAKRVIKKADKVYLLEHNLPQQCADAGFSKVLADFLKDRAVRAIVIPATSAGKDLSAQLAIYLSMDYVANAKTIEVKGNTICVERPLCGGKIMERLSVEGLPAIISIAPRVFGEPTDRGGGAEVTKVEVRTNESGLKVRIKEAERSAEAKDITEAEVIVSGGRGMGGKENFRLLDELASLLGGVIGASRAAVDSGWMPHRCQVGQTGKTVSPRLYVACAISGAPQHIAGMRTSGFVVAVNKDPNAPIFKEADLGIVGDVFKVVPKLIEEIKRARGG